MGFQGKGRKLGSRRLRDGMGDAGRASDWHSSRHPWATVWLDGSRFGAIGLNGEMVNSMLQNVSG